MVNLILSKKPGSRLSSSRTWTPQSLVVEDAHSDRVLITFPSPKTVSASDFTIAGFTVSSGSWTGLVYTLVLSVAVVYGNTLTVVYKGKSYPVTNNTWTPSNLLVVAISGGNRLTWTGIGGSFDGYEILVSINNGAYLFLAYVASNITTYDDLVSTGTLSYRVRAYKGFVYSDYSDAVSITTVAQITDGDGNIYTAITVGTQTWLNKELITTKFLDGTPIDNPAEGTPWHNDGTGSTAAFMYANKNISNKANFGNVYNWFAAHNAKAIAPAGYHVPTLAELNTLITYLGGLAVAGGHLREAGTTYWDGTAAGDDNSSGWSYRAGGYVSADYILGFRQYGILWTYDQYDASNGNYMQLIYNQIAVTLGHTVKTFGAMIRCIKD